MVLQIYTPTSSMWEFELLYILAMFSVFPFSCLAGRCTMVSRYHFSLHFLVTNEVLYFSVVYWPFVYPFIKFLFKSFVHYFYWVFFFLSVWRSFFFFFYSKCESFVEHVLQMLLPIYMFWFCSANNVFWWTEFFILILSNSFFSFIIKVFVSCLRNLCLLQKINIQNKIQSSEWDCVWWWISLQIHSLHKYLFLSIFI